MNIKKKLSNIDRRKFLQGAGVAVSMPLLDFMFENKAYAQAQSAIPSRYLLMTNGLSVGRGNIGSLDFFVPGNTGANYDLPRALQPIKDFAGLQDYISVVSNLSLPFTVGASGDVPAGGYRGVFHNVAHKAQLTGMTIDEQKGKPALPTGPSSDRLLANRLGYGNNFNHINFAVQPKSYRPDTSLASKGVNQFSMTGQRILPDTSPRAFFQDMFGNFVDTDSDANNARKQALEARKSVIDLLDKKRVDYLNRLVSAESRQRMEEHFDHIREIERQLGEEEIVAQGICSKPQDPGADPGLGNNYTVKDPQSLDASVFGNARNGYSNEEKRAEVMTNLIAMAFACDISRIGTLMLSFHTSRLNAFPIMGHRGDYHEMSHSAGSNANYADMQAWHVKHFAKLCDRLRSLSEGGGNILDNSVIAMIHEAGSGRNSDTGKGNSPHSGENMASLIAGKAGGLKGGVHVRTNKQHPTKVLISGMKAAGMTQNNLNQVSGTIGGLFV